MSRKDESVSDMSRSISRKLNAPANEDLVWLALNQLKKETLIANSQEVISNFHLKHYLEQVLNVLKKLKKREFQNRPSSQINSNF